MTYDQWKTREPQDSRDYEDGPPEEEHEYTNLEIAQSWLLWSHYVDPSALMTEEEFSNWTLEERLSFIVGCFGQEGPQ